MSSPEARVASLAQLLERYRQLPRHSNPELRPLRSRLYKLRSEWLRGVHAHNLKQPGFAGFLEFYLLQLDRGIRMDNFLNVDERNLKLAAQSGKTFAMVNGVMEFSLVTQELDDALTQTLGDMDDDQLLQGMASPAQLQTRKQALEQLRHLGPGLAPYAKSRIAYAAFKVATAPFRIGFLGPIFTVMDQGYSALRKVDDVEQAFATLIATNQGAFEQLAG